MKKREQLQQKKEGAAAKERMKKRKLRSDSRQTQITKLKEDAAKLESELAALAREQAEMDKIRAEEKAQYEVNSAERDMIFAGKQRTLSKYWRGCKVVVLQQQFDEKQARKGLRPPMKGASLRVRTAYTLWKGRVSS